MVDNNSTTSHPQTPGLQPCPSSLNTLQAQEPATRIAARYPGPLGWETGGRSFQRIILLSLRRHEAQHTRLFAGQGICFMNFTGYACDAGGHGFESGRVHAWHDRNLTNKAPIGVSGWRRLRSEGFLQIDDVVIVVSTILFFPQTCMSS